MSNLCTLWIRVEGKTWTETPWSDKPMLLRDEIVKPGFYLQTWGKETFVRYVYSFNGDWFVIATRSDGASVTHLLSHYQRESKRVEIDLNRIRFCKPSEATDAQ